MSFEGQRFILEISQPTENSDYELVISLGWGHLDFQPLKFTAFVNHPYHPSGGFSYNSLAESKYQLTKWIRFVEIYLDKRKRNW